MKVPESERMAPPGLKRKLSFLNEGSNTTFAAQRNSSLDVVATESAESAAKKLKIAGAPSEPVAVSRLII